MGTGPTALRHMNRAGPGREKQAWRPPGYHGTRPTSSKPGLTSAPDHGALWWCPLTQLQRGLTPGDVVVGPERQRSAIKNAPRFTRDRVGFPGGSGRIHPAHTWQRLGSWWRRQKAFALGRFFIPNEPASHPQISDCINGGYK